MNRSQPTLASLHVPPMPPPMPPPVQPHIPPQIREDIEGIEGAAPVNVPPLRPSTSSSLPPARQRSTRTSNPIRFWFSTESKLLLLQCVVEHRAHLAPAKQLDSIFENVLNTFINNLPPSTWSTNAKPKVKTLRDKLRAMVKERGESVRNNEVASGIAEEVGEVEELLDDIIHEKDEEEKKKLIEKEKANEAEKRLLDAGEEIREAEAHRKKSDETDKESKNTRKRRRFEDEDDDWEDMIKTEMKKKRESEIADRELRAAEVQMIREKWEEDKKDRDLARLQNHNQLELIDKLLNKLN